MAAAARRRFLPAWIKRSLIGLACLPIALPLLVLTALAVPLTRRPIVVLALDLTNDALADMRVEIDHVDRLDLWGIELRGGRFYDTLEHEMVRAKSVRVRIAPLALVTGKLVLTSAHVEGVRVHIQPSEEPEGEEPEDESAPSSFQIVVHALRVADVTLDMALSGRALHALLVELEAAGAYGPETRVGLRALDLRADVDGERALTLRSRYARWDQERGGDATLRGELLGARLRIAASVPKIDEKTRWPLKRADLVLQGLTNEGLAKLGLAETAQLKVPADLHVYAETQGAQAEVLSAKLELDAGDAHLRVRGQATPSTYAAELSLPPVQLASLSGVLPSLHVGARLEAELRHDVSPMTARLAFQELSLDGRAVPNGELRAALALPVVRLESLRFAGLERALALSGRYDTATGAAEVELDTHEFNLASLGGLLPAGTRGALNGGVRANLAGQRLSGRSDLSLRYFRFGSNTIDSARLSLDLGGTLKEPRGEISLGAYQIALDKTRLRKVEFDAVAEKKALEGRLSVAGAEHVASLTLRGTRADDGKIALDAQGAGRFKDKQLGLTLRALEIAPGGNYTVENLTAFSGAERVYLAGGLTGGEVVDASIQITNLSLRSWSRMFMADALTGLVNVNARLGGTIRQPSAQLSLALRGLHWQRAPRAPAVDLEAEVGLDLPARKAALSVHAHSQDRRVELTLTSEAALARAKALGDAFKRAKLKLDLNGYTDIPFLAQFAEPQLGALDGKVTADVSLSGDLDEAELYAKVATETVPRDAREKSAPDRADLDVVLKPESLDVDLIVRDPFGEVVDLTSHARLPPGGPKVLLERGAALIHTPVELKLTLNERRLDKLRGSLGMLARTYGAALPVRVKAQVHVASTGEALTGKVTAAAHLWGEGLDSACSAQAEGDVALSATLAGDKAEVLVTAQPQGGGKAEIALRSPLLVDRLLDGSSFGWGPAALTARGEGLALHTLPTLCALPESRTRFALDARNLGKVPMEAKLSLDVEDVPNPDGPSMGLHLDARSSATAIQADGKLKLGGAVHGQFSAQAPLVYAEGPVPSVPLDRPFRAALDLPDFPLAALASFTSAVGRAGGRVRANIALGGTLESPSPSGVIELKKAELSIAALAQPFSDLNARFELAPDRLVIRALKARDRSGKLSLTGYARYNPTRGGDAELHLTADKFPIRQQGSIVGELSTRAVLEGKLDAAQKLALALEIESGRIWMTGEGGQAVQDLDEHPDVRFDTEQANLAELKPKARESGIVLEEFRIRSEKDLWLMHEDFSVQVGVDLKLSNKAEGITLGGRATVTRGDLNLLGKPFRIEKGEIRFTGDVPPDPELDLKANHKTREGKVLTVQVQGRGSQPIIIFSGAANNAGEAAMLLSGMGGAGAESKAKGDAASFAAGLTAGLLAVSARRKFGDWVPMLAIENSASGAPSGARAGFDASALIPKFMRGFARSMYVEGVVGSRSDTTARGVGVGVRVEVSLPRDFATALSYGPGTVWSTDAYWTP